MYIHEEQLRRADDGATDRLHARVRYVSYSSTAPLTEPLIIGSVLFRDNSVVTDDDLRVLRDLTQLEELAVVQCHNVTDRGITAVCELAHLRVMVLCGTPVTDAVITSLRRLSTLRNLDVRDTRVTPAGVAALARALPKCRIAADGGVIEQRG